MAMEVLRALARSMSEHDMGILLRHWLLEGGEHAVFMIEVYRHEEDGGSFLRRAEVRV